jgi:hypothetical protein
MARASDSRTARSPLAPTDSFRERANTYYERKQGLNTVRRGPLRFEEGISTDTDVPNDFQLGVMQGYVTAPGRPNHNKNVYEKSPEETMKERAHVGSAAWPESQQMVGEFAHGSYSPYAEQKYEQVDRSGTPGNPSGRRFERTAAAVVTD